MTYIGIGLGIGIGLVVGLGLASGLGIGLGLWRVVRIRQAIYWQGVKWKLNILFTMEVSGSELITEILLIFDLAENSMYAYITW